MPTVVGGTLGGIQPMSRQKERRKFRRRDCLLRCRCEGKGFRFDGYIVNLSYGGAGINGTEKLPSLGTELLVTLGHTWKNLQLRSRVVWAKSDTKEPGLANFGVEFLDSLYVRQEKLAYFFPKCNTFED